MLSFSPWTGLVFLATLVFSETLFHIKKWHPFLSADISFISGWPVYWPAASVPYGQLCAHGAARWLCFCSSPAQRSGPMSFLAPLSHSLLKSVWRTLMNEPERWQVVINEKEKWWFRSVKSKGRWRIRLCLNAARRHARDAEPGDEKPICSFKWKSRNNGRCHFLVKNGN